MVKQVDFKGQAVEVVYDTLGRKTAQKYYATASTTSSEEIQFTYDDMGRTNTIVSPQGTTEYTYNARGEVTQISSPEGTVNYVYDAKTGAKTCVWTSSSDVRYAYDALSRLKTVTVHKRNGLELTTPEVTSYDYTKVGSRASVAFSNGITTNYQYDNLNRLTKLSHKRADELVASYTYELLPTGRRAAVTEVTPEGSSTIRYTYDNLYRLTGETRTGVKPFSASYAYDINSNRIQKVISGSEENDTINYTYNANDQLTTEVSSANGTTVYTYDANGSLTTKVNAGKFDCRYTYDLRNRLSHADVTRKEGLVDVTISSNYAYNAAGIRTRAEQTINGITQSRYFLLESGLTGYAQVLEETSSLGGNVVRSYVLGDDVLSQTVGSATSYLLYDGHGSTRQLANSNGDITDNYAYDAYGKMLGGDPNVTDKQSATDLLYAGEQFDPGLQMEYLRARYYDQNTGRFNRLDPFGGNSEDPQSLHKYAYAHCDPINNIDPSGESLASVMMSLMFYMSHPIFAMTQLVFFLGTKISWIIGAFYVGAGMSILGNAMQSSEKWKGLEVGGQNCSLRFMQIGNVLMLGSTFMLASVPNMQGMKYTHELDQTNKEIIGRFSPIQQQRYVTVASAKVVGPNGKIQTVTATSGTSGFKGATPQNGQIFLKGQRGMHAEAQIMRYAENTNSKVLVVNASRPICNNCALAIRTDPGAIAMSPLKNNGEMIPGNPTGGALNPDIVACCAMCGGND